jgi:N-acetylgalactosamine kinase
MPTESRREPLDAAGCLCSGELLTARVPGRIDLLGAHTVYNGFPVLSMAVNRNITARFSPVQEATVSLSNTDPRFPDRRFRIQEAIPPYPHGDWGNPFKAAVQGLLDFYGRKGKAVKRFSGLKATLDRNAAAPAGTGRCSALMVLGALMFLAANGIELEDPDSDPPAAGARKKGLPAPARLELAGLLARAERYLGARGEGTDQALALLARPGRALQIESRPLRCRSVLLPESHTVVVADSLAESADGGAAGGRYRWRQIECALAAAVMQNVFAGHYGREVPLFLLGDLQEQRLAVRQEEIRELAGRCLHRQPYRLREIAAILGQSPEKTAYLYCGGRDGSILSEPQEGFKLFQRYRHVVDEAQRVEQSVEALETGDISRVGALMNQSHRSCRELYESGCPETDTLVEISRQAGALGARLTGDRSGACTVSLVPNDRIDLFCRQVIRHYYLDYLKHQDADFASLVFPCRAEAGAGVLAG